MLFVFSCESKEKEERERVEREIVLVEDSLKIISGKLLCKSPNGSGFTICPNLIDSTKLSGSAYDLMVGKIDPHTPEYHRLHSLRDFYNSRHDSLKFFLEDSIRKQRKIDSLNSLRKDPFYSPKITISDEDMKKILQNVKFDEKDSLSK